MEYIVGIINDNLFGLVARPFFIHKPRDKGFYPIEAQISEFNIPKYEKDLSPDQKKIFNITQEYSESKLYKLFKGKKDKSTKEFLKRLKKEDANKRIRPYIEKRLVRITDILRNSNIEVYFKDKHKFINKDNRVYVQREFASTIFNIIKDTHETRYFLSINQDHQEINLLNKPYSIIAEDPCRIIIENHLYSFSDIDVKKILPFFNKEYITVPKNFEKRWFETFALPNIKKHEVNPVGFDIKHSDPRKSVTLSLEEDLEGKPALTLRFHYGKHTFDKANDQTIRVDLDTSGEIYTFIKFERDIKWENEKIKFLENINLKNHIGSFFKPVELTDTVTEKNEDLLKLIDWLKTNKEKLYTNGFQIEQQFYQKKYSLDNLQIVADTKEYNDWFDIKAKVNINGHSIPFSSLKKHILQGIREFKLPDGTFAILPEEWFTKYSDVFKFGKVEDNHLFINKHHFKILGTNFKDYSGTYLDRLKELTEDFQDADISLPHELNAILRSYQKTGFKWMYLLRKHHFGGCLADDMGLGKTIQTLTLIKQVKKEVPSIEVETEQINKLKQLNLFNQPEDKPDKLEVTPTFLIVMPTSLIHNWQNEIQKFTPELSVYKHTGLHRTNHPLELYRYDIVLTTYGIVRNDYEILKKVDFTYIILDESQYIKNPSSKIYQAVNKLKSQYKMVLTGTPIENSLSDLWAQLNFLNKGLLGNYNFFRNEFILPIEKYKDEVKEEKLRNIIDPFILRRTKHQVAKELPEKMEQVIYCDMTEEQQSYYDSEKSKIRNSILEQIEGSEQHSALRILDGLSKLRQTANHPVMVDEEYTGGSGKFTEIKDYLESLISESHKVLVFSSYKKHLRLVEDHLNTMGWKYAMLTGETHNRQKVVDAFQKDENKQVFLIQIKAGGFGLNLTSADYVMILDPWWNPAVEEQAINRAHRIGQDKNVMVYRFISVDTVEEKIQKLQAKKAKLAESFVTAKETIRNLSREQILELFK